MRRNLPSYAIPQPDEQAGRDTAGNDTLSVAFRGPYDDLLEWAQTLKPGDVIHASDAQDAPNFMPGWVYSSHDIRRTPADFGVLSVHFIPESEVGEGEGGQPGEAEPLKDVWSIQSVRNDVSIMAYCGNAADNPNRALIEAWMKEPDGSLAAKHQFRTPDGEIVELTDKAATMDLVEKIEKGIESVVRFYPVVTRTRTYADCPPKCLENLGFVAAPPTADREGMSRKSDGLDTVIADYEWLKVRDDVAETTDGKWTRTESWWGIKKTTDNQHPWDADLYGPNRWPMPYSHHDNAQG